MLINILDFSVSEIFITAKATNLIYLHPLS